MGVKKVREHSRELEEVRQRFRRWRRTRKRGRIPDVLWEMAVEAAKTFGVAPVAGALGLEDDSLEEQVRRRAKAGSGSARAAATTFVELTPPVSAGGCRCTLEWEDAGGAKMRLRLEGVAMSDVAVLCRSLWGRTP